VARHKHPENEPNAASARIALTSAYLKVIYPGIDQITLTRRADSILALIDGEDRRLPQKKITDPQAVEMVWRHSQCVRNQTGKCPLLVFVGWFTCRDAPEPFNDVSSEIA
jgi:hypothetical protein